MREGGWANLYCIGGFAFSLQGSDRELRQLADSVYAGARTAHGQAAIRFELARGSSPGTRVYTMSAAGVEICRQHSLADFFLDVEWVLTQRAMAALGTVMQVHAGAVVVGDAGILICGPPGSGKTSLVVGLMDQGATVLTDEIGLLQPATAAPPGCSSIELLAFPRDLIVHARTQSLFPSSAYGDEPCFKRFPDRCYVNPGLLAATPLRPRAPLRRLLFTSFRPGHGLAAARLGPAEAARRLMRHTYNLEALGEACAEQVARVVESCPAWSIRFGDAAEASPAIAALIADDGG